MCGKAEHFERGKTEHVFNPLPPSQLSWNFADVRSYSDNIKLWKKNGRGEKITQSSINITHNHKSKRLEISLSAQIKSIQSICIQHITTNQNIDTKK